MRGLLSCAVMLVVACSEQVPSESPGVQPSPDSATAAPPEELEDAQAPVSMPRDASEPTILDAASVAAEAGAPHAVDGAVAHSDTGTSPAPRSSLALPDAWTLLDAASDPFDHRPALVDCGPDGVVAELLGAERVLGVETGTCNYLTAQQPAQRAVAAGELLKVRLWHFELSAPDPAEAHAVILVDGLPLLDERIPIPQPGGLIVRQLRVERDIAAAAPVIFHLHNHGANSWALVEVSAGPG